MLKIGFADYYLDNWHANHYPGFLRDVIARYGYDAKVTHAFGIHEAPPEGGLSTGQWCAERNICPAESMEQLVEEVDAILVIAADNFACTVRTPRQTAKGRGNLQRSILSVIGAMNRNRISTPMKTGWCCGIKRA